MKKFFYLMSMGFIAVSFTACNEEKIDDGSLVLGEDDAKEVTINRLGGFIEIPVTATGEWTASLPEDCTWAKVINDEDSGTGAVTIFTDYLNPENGEDRRADLTVTSGKTTKSIRIRQYLGKHDGENDNATVSEDAWGNTVLGMGVNIVNTGNGEDGMFKGNWVTSSANAKQIAQQSNRYNRVFVSTTSAADIGSEGVAKELHSKMDTLGIHASVSVTYGLFTLKIEGDYESNETEVQNKVSYSTEYQAPRAKAWLGARDLAALANSTVSRRIYEDEEEYKQMRNLKNMALTGGFDEDRAAIMDKFDEIFAKYDDEADIPEADSTWKIPSRLNSMLKSLDTNYGPVYISSILMGGSTFLNIEYDSIFVTDTLHIDGSIKVDITSGLLNVKAGVEAGYLKTSKNIMEHSKSTFMVRGGSTDKRSAVMNALTLKETQVDKEVTKDLDIERVHQALAEWSASVPNGEPKESNKDLFAAISYGYSPVWAFFGEYASYVREFFIRTYKNKDTLLDLESM